MYIPMETVIVKLYFTAVMNRWLTIWTCSSILKSVIEIKCIKMWYFDILIKLHFLINGPSKYTEVIKDTNIQSTIKLILASYDIKYFYIVII